MESGSGAMTHVWRWRVRMPERHGQLFRVLCRGRLNSMLILFADGQLVVTSRFAGRWPLLYQRPAVSAGLNFP